MIFNVINNGEQTASNVEIEGVLKNGSESVETSGVTIDYVPSKSEAKGGLFFKKIRNSFKSKSKQRLFRALKKSET